MSSSDVPGWMTLASDETVVWSGRPSPYLVKYLIAVGAVVLLAGAVAPVWILPANWSWTGWLLIVAGLGVGAYAYLGYHSVYHVITSDKVYKKTGLFPASVFSRIDVSAIGIAVLSIALGAVTWTTFQAQSLEQQTQTELQQRFDEADIEGVEFVSVTVDYEPDDILLGNEPVINVVAGIPRNLEAPPDFAKRWDDELSEEFGRDVVVRAGFLEAQVSEEEPPEPPLGWPTFVAPAPNAFT